jgi:hypothetical protein
MTPDGVSKGWGIVEFVRAESAAEALASNVALDGVDVEIREDKLSRPLPGAASLTSPTASKEKRVYVGNLPWDATWQDVKDVFKSCGKVIRVSMFTHPDGRSRVRMAFPSLSVCTVDACCYFGVWQGCALVEFASEEACAVAIETLNNTEMNGRVIYVREVWRLMLTSCSLWFVICLRFGAWFRVRTETMELHLLEGLSHQWFPLPMRLPQPPILPQVPMPVYSSRMFVQLFVLAAPPGLTR